MKFWLIVGAICGFTAVAFGAFGAHGIAATASSADLAAFETGARYHMYHSLALLAVAWLASRQTAPTRAIAVAGWAFVAGIVLFSGSLYVLGITGSRALVWITPVGGVAFLIGWAALAASALRR
jgi:uncharacterized membrane protein YgdD (TMEM256/DUF423 family)